MKEIFIEEIGIRFDVYLFFMGEKMCYIFEILCFMILDDYSLFLISGQVLIKELFFDLMQKENIVFFKFLIRFE